MWRPRDCSPARSCKATEPSRDASAPRPLYEGIRKMFATTGATGQLGRLVIDALQRTVPAERIVAAVRDPAKAHDLATHGVNVREADYNRPDTLATAFAGVEKLLLKSPVACGGIAP